MPAGGWGDEDGTRPSTRSAATQASSWGSTWAGSSCAAVAEREHGHGRDASTFAFVSVGTGIGMGLVLDGKLHRGAHGAAGEIAFLPLTDGDLDPRDAQRRGALESAASAAAVVRAARR